MSEIRRLCRRFEKLNPGYECSLDEISSWSGSGSACGNYRIYIGNKETQIGSWYTFRSIREFREWVNNVIMEG